MIWTLVWTCFKTLKTWNTWILSGCYVLLFELRNLGQAPRILQYYHFRLSILAHCWNIRSCLSESICHRENRHQNYCHQKLDQRSNVAQKPTCKISYLDDGDVSEWHFGWDLLGLSNGDYYPGGRCFNDKHMNWNQNILRFV